MILRDDKRTPWVRGSEQVILAADLPTVLDAIRVILTTTPIYRNAREDANHMAFAMTINLFWSLIGLPIRITVAGQGVHIIVNVAVASRWWLLTDVYGVCDQRIQDFVRALEQQIAQEAN
ncbi:MAG: hypothetical protein M3176_18905 [Chloroflexota bacterium]|nr:hypothetical protein [Chloroflexota bacterium]